MSELTTGSYSNQEPKHHEIYHPDFMWVTYHSDDSDPISATRVPKIGGHVKQFIRANKVKPAVRKELGDTAYIWTKGMGPKKAYTRHISETKPEGKGWKKWVYFDLVQDDECTFEQRQPVDWTTSFGREIKGALWHGSADAYISPAKAMEMIEDSHGGLAFYHMVEHSWKFLPSHDAWDALMAARKTL